MKSQRHIDATTHPNYYILLRTAYERILVLALRYDIVTNWLQISKRFDTRYPNPLQYNDNLIDIFYVKIVVRFVGNFIAFGKHIHIYIYV